MRLGSGKQCGQKQDVRSARSQGLGHTGPWRPAQDCGLLLWLSSGPWEGAPKTHALQESSFIVLPSRVSSSSSPSSSTHPGLYGTGMGLPAVLAELFHLVYMSAT